MNIPTWLFYSLISGLLWGLWGYLGKLASRSMSGENLLLTSSLGWVAALPIFFLFFRSFFKFQPSNPDTIWALLSGLAGSVGVVFFYSALARGEASRVVAITAAYPVITAILAFVFLREPVTYSKVIGLSLAGLGIYFLSR